MFSFGRRCNRTQIGDIAVVHADYHIEIVKIGYSDLTAMMVKLQSAATGMNPHTRVGELPYMVSSRAGRVYYKPFGTFLFQYALHHAFGSRRPAYIAKTHKEYTSLILQFLISHHIPILFCTLFKTIKNYKKTVF